MDYGRRLKILESVNKEIYYNIHETYVEHFKIFLEEFKHGGLFYCDEIGLLKEKIPLHFLGIVSDGMGYKNLSKSIDLLNKIANFETNRESDEVGDDDRWKLIYETYVKLVDICPKVEEEFIELTKNVMIIG